METAADYFKVCVHVRSQRQEKRDSREIHQLPVLSICGNSLRLMLEPRDWAPKNQELKQVSPKTETSNMETTKNKTLNITANNTRTSNTRTICFKDVGRDDFVRSSHPEENGSKIDFPKIKK